MDHDRIKRIVSEALDLDDSQRDAFVRKACDGDATLLNEVLSLLQAASGAEHAGFMPTSEAANTAAATAPSNDPNHDPARHDAEMPDRIGRYRILERIGGGGMGEVYVAEQTEPIKRRVAVKLIKAGMDTKQVVARFEAERQALAMMDHPNIARVIDAGATDTGRPYFVMELVRGVPITRFADDNKLTTRQRVELLIPICQAVQHAHQKGIIHRDIKPHNVLVTLHDGKPVPKVIDFGIAKATSQALTDKTIYTEFRQMIGTPAYMSPEQAEMSGLDIDTRSDIYSLGVLAYELLTGSPPFDSERLVKAGLNEIQRIIREEDPPRPSIRFSTMGDRLTTIAKSRDVEPSKLSKLLAGELDWIVMRAMEKDRKRRYDTATDLAADFNRHLNGEPVVAAPPTLAYRTRKFLKKHQGLVIATAVSAGTLSVGLAVALFQMSRAIRAEHQAVAQRVELSEAADSVSQSLQDLLTGINSVDDHGTDTWRGTKIPGTDYWYMDHSASGSHSIRVYRPGVKAKGAVDASVFDRPQQPVPSGILLKGMSQAVKEGIEYIQDEDEQSKLEAYTADLALAQSAMSSGNWPEARARLDACPESKRGWEWTFLRKQAGETKYPVRGDFFGISNDARRFLAATLTGQIHLFDSLTGKPCGKPLDGVPKGGLLLKRCFLSPAADLFATAYTAKYRQEELENSEYGYFSIGDTLEIWNTATGAVLSKVPVPEGIAGIAFSQDGLRFATWNCDRELTRDPARPFIAEVWDTWPCPTRSVRVAQAEGCESALFSPDGSRLLTVSGGSVTIWNSRTGAEQGRFICGKMDWDLNSDPLKFSPDGSLIITISAGKLQAWDASSGNPVNWVNRQDGVRAATFSRDGTRLIISDRNGWIRLEDPSSGNRYWERSVPEIREYENSYEVHHRITLLTDGDFALEATTKSFEGASGFLQLFDSNGEKLGAIGSDQSTFDKQSSEVFLVGTSMLRINEVDTTIDGYGPEIATMAIDAEVSDPTALPRSPQSTLAKPLDMKIIPNGSLEISNTSNSGSPVSIGVSGNPISGFAISPDKTRLVTADETDIRFYLCDEWRELAAFPIASAVKNIRFTPDGTRLIVQFADGSAQIWDPRPLAERRKMWARRAAERTPAREYVDRLLATAAATQPADLKKLIREDATITPLRKLVAMEQLDIELQKRQREAERKSAGPQPTKPATQP